MQKKDPDFVDVDNPVNRNRFDFHTLFNMDTNVLA